MFTCSLSFASHNFSLTAASRFSSPLCCSIAILTCYIRRNISDVVIKKRKKVQQQQADEHMLSTKAAKWPAWHNFGNAADLAEDLIHSLSALYVFQGRVPGVLRRVAERPLLLLLHIALIRGHLCRRLKSSRPSCYQFMQLWFQCAGFASECCFVSGRCYSWSNSWHGMSAIDTLPYRKLLIAGLSRDVRAQRWHHSGDCRCQPGRMGLSTVPLLWE